MTSSVVIDTSVFISGILTPKGNANLALVHAFQNQEVLFSQATFAELERKLYSPKFSRYLKPETTQTLLNQYAKLGTWVELETIEAVSRDRNDDMFLETARVGEASCIISLDKDLLTLNPWRKIEIIKPLAYLEKLV